jgi:hypothetical protein
MKIVAYIGYVLAGYFWAEAYVSAPVKYFKLGYEAAIVDFKNAK